MKKWNLVFISHGRIFARRIRRCVHQNIYFPLSPVSFGTLFFSRKIISVVSFPAMFFTGKLTRKFGSDKNFEKSQVGEARIRRNTCHNEVFLSSAFGYGASAAVRRRCCSHSRPYARCNERERDKERKVDRPSDFQFGLHELETVCA